MNPEEDYTPIRPMTPNDWLNSGAFDNINAALDDVAEASERRHDRDDRAAEAQIAMRNEIGELHRRLQEESESRRDQYRLGQEEAARQRRMEWLRWGVASGIASLALVVSTVSCVQGGAG